ncbi:hypothetical protein NUM3379_28480 [Kineococcus sp. NUM-3379]
MMRIEPPTHLAEFSSVMRAEGITGPEVFGEVEIFDETPLYSRLHQLAFLAPLSIREQNRALIRVATWLLEEIERHRQTVKRDDPSILQLVSLTGWQLDGDDGRTVCNDGQLDLIKPHIWEGNLTHEHMRHWGVHSPLSRGAQFVMESIGYRDAYDVFEGDIDFNGSRCPRRIYVSLRGSVPIHRVRRTD